MKLKRRFAFWLGIGCCAAGVLLAAQVPYFFWRAHVRGHQLTQLSQEVLNGTASATGGSDAGRAGTSDAPAIHGLPLVSTQVLASSFPAPLVALLTVPKLQLQAPVLAGTGDAVLNVAAGHLSDSAAPGDPGLCIVAAHNATWFRHLDELQPGDVVTLETPAANLSYAVTGHEVVRAGTSLRQTGAAALALEACYPLDALHLTASRYIVMATLTSATPRQHALASTAYRTAATYTAQIPAQLAREGVTLSSNAMTMGSLRYTGRPSPSYEQSDAPLSATYTLLQLFLAYVKASEQGDMSALYAMLPHPVAGAGMSAAAVESAFSAKQLAQNLLYNARDVQFAGPFDVTLSVSGAALRSATGETTFRQGGVVYKVSIICSNDASNVLHIISANISPSDHHQE